MPTAPLLAGKPAAGENTYAHTWINVYGAAPNEMGQSNNYVVASGTITLDETGDSWTQSFLFAHGRQRRWRRPYHPWGQVHAKRLYGVSEDEIGSPLEIIPTWAAMATPT